MRPSLKIVKPTISDEAMADLALELAKKEEEDLQRLINLVLSRQFDRAVKLAEEMRNAN